MSEFVCIESKTVKNLPTCWGSACAHYRPQVYGSDVLVRPDDEDSPEYQDYLRQLLSLQANRAKSGHSSPSSGSSDAYIAKLNRLKVEKLALERAGVKDPVLDMSYKPEDYEAAKYEAMEPQVASAVLTGDAAVARPAGPKNSNKERPLTHEEIQQQKLADERVKAALAAEAALPPEERAAREAKRRADDLRRSKRPEIKLDAEASNIIESLLGQSKRGNKAGAVLQPSAEAFEPQPASEVLAPPLVSADSAKKPTTTHSGTSRVAPSDQTVGSTDTSQVTANLQASENVSMQPPEDGRNLNAEEMDIAAKALQSLVKHRGGAPFGVVASKELKPASLSKTCVQPWRCLPGTQLERWTHLLLLRQLQRQLMSK